MIKLSSFLLLFLILSPAATKEYSSVTTVYTISIPDSWNVEVERKKTEIYFKDDANVGQFEIAVTPFLAQTNAKAEYYTLKDVYKEATLTKINDVQVVICTLVDGDNKEYNWIFYHGKYQVWCQYIAIATSEHKDEVKQVEAAVKAMKFYALD